MRPRTIRQWSESRVTRTATGRTRRRAETEAQFRDIRSAGLIAEQADQRADRRLRWGADTQGVWFCPAGDRYWVPRHGNGPQWIGDYYYSHRSAWPVVPPRATWTHRDEYAGLPGQTVCTQYVPDDVLAAAYWYGGGRYEEDGSIRSELWRASTAYRVEVVGDRVKPASMLVRLFRPRKPARAVS